MNRLLSIIFCTIAIVGLPFGAFALFTGSYVHGVAVLILGAVLLKSGVHRWSKPFYDIEAALDDPKLVEKLGGAEKAAEVKAMLSKKSK